TAAPITVTADAKSKVYGAADPALTYQLTSGALVAGDSFGGALTRAAGANVGSYAIQQGLLTAGGNYTLTFAGANLTITPAALTVTADNKSRIQGLANPALTATITGFVNGDTLSVVSGAPAFSTAAMPATPVDTYPIVVTARTLSAVNYTFTTF